MSSLSSTSIVQTASAEGKPSGRSTLEYLFKKLVFEKKNMREETSRGLLEVFLPDGNKGLISLLSIHMATHHLQIETGLEILKQAFKECEMDLIRALVLWLISLTESANKSNEKTQVMAILVYILKMK